MLEVERTTEGEAVRLRLKGSIDDEVDLKARIGAAAKTFLVHCAGLKRINSIGVKNWVTTFREHEKNGVRLEFFECPPAIVQQLNSYQNFACGGTVHSILLPYACTSCEHSFEPLATIDELRAKKWEVGNLACPECQGEAEFDDLPWDYLAFAMK